MHIRKLSDEKILELAQKFGSQARLWRQRFIGLLPEVNRRRLYEKKFSSIYVFAYKVGGLTKKQVLRALNLEQKFADKPVLKNLFENGEVSINKLSKIAYIAEKNSEEFWAEKAKILSTRALETLVRDERVLQGSAESEIQNGFLEPESSANSVHVNRIQLLQKISEKFSDGLIQKISELDQKGLDINQIFLELLEKREEEIEQEQQQISESVLQRQRGTSQTVQTAGTAETAERAGRNADAGNECIPDEESDSCRNERTTERPPNENSNPDKCQGSSAKAKTHSHYINVASRKFLTRKYGNKCSIVTCNNLAEEIHHTQRFALSQNHDPNFLAPLCKQHHQIAHSIDQKYLLKRQY